MDEARAVRDFWFGQLPLDRAGDRKRMRFWFGAGLRGAARRDEEIRRVSAGCSSAPRAVSSPPGPTARAGA